MRCSTALFFSMITKNIVRTVFVSTSVFVSILSAQVTYAVSASTETQQPSTGVQKAVEEVRDRLETLITAKDSGTTDDRALRIETFKKVIAVATAEAIDMKAKLVALPITDTQLALWRTDSIARIDAALLFYTTQLDAIADIAADEPIAKIKERAEQFKEWRTEHYITAANEAKDYLLMTQLEQAIATATKRVEKIALDVTILQKARVKGVVYITKLLTKASSSVAEASTAYHDAQKLFTETYVTPLIIRMSTSTATSTEKNNALPLRILESTVASSTESMSLQKSVEDALPLPNVSVRDLVRQSITKVKDAYQTFIDMSSAVRELLS